MAFARPFVLDLNRLLCIYAIGALVGCNCSGDSIFTTQQLTVSPEETTLRPGASERVAVYYQRTLGADQASIPTTIGDGLFAISLTYAGPSRAEPGLPSYLTFTDEDGDVLGFRGSTNRRNAHCSASSTTLVCTWEGTLSLASDAPASVHGDTYSLEARAHLGGSGSATVRLQVGETLDAGLEMDAGDDVCAATPCVNGMAFDTGDGCRCACDEGWLGAACDERPAVVTTLAGEGVAGFQDGTGASARFRNPSGIDVGPDGRVYVVDTGNRAVRTIDPTTGTVSTLVGAPDRGFADGPIASAGFDTPSDVAVASDGTVYVIERMPPRLRVIAGGSVATLPFEVGYYEGMGLAWRDTGGPGTLYLALGYTVGILDLRTPERMLTPAGTYFTREILDGVGEAAGFSIATDVSVGEDGMLYVTDYGGLEGGAIRRMDPSSGEVRTWVGAVRGMGRRTFIGAGPLAGAHGLAVLDGGAVIASESRANRLRRFRDTAGFAYSTDVAGERWEGTTDVDGAAGFVDGEGADARFSAPRALAVSPDESTLYVVDGSNHAVRAVSL
jgi:DNA-binding beta-propeller fold protein YncE